jgi:hypothetical protein
LDAVLKRIQTTKVEASFAGDPDADVIASGATSAMLRLIASVSIGVMCIAAASFAYLRIGRHPSEPARDAKPAPAMVVAAPSLPVVAQPAQVPPEEVRANVQQSSASRDETETQPRPANQRRRSRTAVQRQQVSRNAVAAPAVEASKPTTHDTSSEDVPVSANAVADASSSESAVSRHSSESAARPAAKKTQATASLVAPVDPEPSESKSAAATEAEPKLPAPPPTELAIMKRMQSALRSADYSTVLALCAEHARRWPHGVFEVEREGARAIASCGEGSGDAAPRAKTFLSAHPNVPVAMRVNAACAVQLKKR